VAAKRQKVEAWDVPAEVYDPLDQGTASTFDLEQYRDRALRWIDTEALHTMTDFPRQYFIRKEEMDIFGILEKNQQCKLY